MNMEYNVSLLPYNTFRIDVSADQFARFDNAASLQSLICKSEIFNHPILILGGGSNVLLTTDFKGTVLRNEIIGIECIHENEDLIYIKVGGGVVWHEFVMYCVDKGWGGLENLALIPGSVGAAPMQNIGAYGVEIQQVFHQADAISLTDGSMHHFNKEQCKFGYRESIFKHELKGKMVITHVSFVLTKNPILNTCYGAIKEELGKMGTEKPNIRDIADAVIRIRKSKLPDPKVLGNAGSFFKNPEIEIKDFELLQTNFPDIVGYPLPDYKVKLAAGWLIEKAGWKGVSYGDAGCHHKQALVLVNHGKATGFEIFQLSEKIISSVHEKFNVMLHREVNIY